MNIDVVIVSNAYSAYLKMITESTIRTAQRGERDVKLNFFIVEQQGDVNYPGHTTLHYSFPFNYNQCLNLGIKAGKSKYVALCNNDLVFYKYWGWNSLIALKKYKSISPTTKPFDGYIEGYKVEKQITGWCIIAERKMLEKIGYLDTPCEFWYSDNVYAFQLEQQKIKHALVGNVIVRHLTSVTLNKLPYKQRQQYMRKQATKFNQYKQNYVNQSIKE